MYNDHVSNEEAQMLIQERRKEAETYGLQKQLGYGDSRSARWILLLVVILVSVAVILLL